MKKILMTSLLCVGCNTVGTTSACYTLCQELFQTCDYAAFPTFQSCEEGCVYKQEQGADIEGQLTCIQEAECNEFAVIECEHTFGATDE
ncbi:MAG: hypothetical protein VX278_02495 [Myxococcota bacterium]|nr:hypothetical protein [Myxococcota bacterium]